MHRYHLGWIIGSAALLLTLSAAAVAAQSSSATVKIPDTGQNRCYSNTRVQSRPGPNQSFFGQDAQYRGHQPAYRDNGDGTITDLTTGLMWSKAVSSQKLGLTEAHRKAKNLTLAGHRDWRVPNIKELYSLIDFRGYTGFAGRGGISSGSVPSNAIPFINTDYFDFRYGASGERYIDAQWLSSTKYVSTTMDGNKTLFGVNFADGRIKGYGYTTPRSQRQKRFYVRYVRGATTYGKNHFKDNGDGTVTDHATGLTWAKMDSGQGMPWKSALAYAENLKLGGHSDWRLPNAKELQYIVDYSRSPDTTNSPAIDPIFRSSSIVNEKGQRDYPSYWTSTTHLDGPSPGNFGVYVAFGRAMGQMRGRTMDVHGAGAQRSDPKTGNAMLGHGPQGDAIRVNNYVRVVRGGGTIQSNTNLAIDRNAYPYKVNYPKSDGGGSSQQQPGFLGLSNSMGQGPSGGMGQGGFSNFPQHFVQRLDNDGDGKVSRNEFDGPSDHFDHLDRDGDGYLSVDEAPQRPPPGRGGS